jgi:hypothetical protein
MELKTKLNETSRLMCFKVSRNVRRLLFCVFWSCFCACFYGKVCTAKADAQNSQTVVLQGYLIYTNHFLPNHETKSFQFSFKRNECSWLVGSGSQSRQLGYTETGFDGTNVYRYTYWNSEPAEKMRAKTNQAYFATGEVKPTSIPDFDVAWSRHIWFALMPHSCGPMIDLRPCDLITGTKVITNCNRIIFPAFEKIGSYVTNAVVWSQGNDVLEDGRVVPLAPPLDKGFTNLVYMSSMADWTNASLKAPGKFEYHVFAPMGGAATLVWSLYGTVTNVLLESTLNALPEIIDHIYVVDIRAQNLAGGQIVNYLAKNRWLQPGEPEFQKLISVEAQNAAITKRHRVAKLVVVGFAAATGLFLVFVAVKSRRSPK